MIFQGTHGSSFSKKKSKVCEIFSELKALIENSSGLKIKILTSDNGGEYVSNELRHIFSQSGIQVQHSIAYTPQQNESSGKEESVSQGDDHLYVGIKEVG